MPETTCVICKVPLLEDALTDTCDWECHAARVTARERDRFFDNGGRGHGIRLARTPKGYLVDERLLPALES